MSNERDVLTYLQLQLHIQHPDLDDIWLEGYEAGLKNFTEAGNPYKKGSTENTYWSEGWWSAFYGEQESIEIISEQVTTTTIDTTHLISANDASIDSNPRKEKLLTFAFETLCVLFVSIAAYSLYDMAA